MPAGFLTDSQEQRYGRYDGEPTTAQLARFFYLDDTDSALVAQQRQEHTRLGFALQLCTVRFLGTFLPDPTDVPPSLVRHLAQQLRIDDPVCLERYRDTSTQWAHTSEIRQHYGYQDFAAQPAHFRFVRWLATRAWLSAERSSVLDVYFCHIWWDKPEETDAFIAAFELLKRDGKVRLVGVSTRANAKSETPSPLAPFPPLRAPGACCAGEGENRIPVRRTHDPSPGMGEGPGMREDWPDFALALGCIWNDCPRMRRTSILTKASGTI